MNFQTPETNNFCNGSRCRFPTASIFDNITFNKRTATANIFLIRHFSKCNRKKSITVSSNTIAAENFGDFFKSLSKGGLIRSKEMAKMFFKKTRHEPRILQPTLLVQLFLETIKQFYQHYLMRKFSIKLVEIHISKIFQKILCS